MVFTLDNAMVPTIMVDFGTPLWWKARYTDAVVGSYGLATKPDPHHPSTLAHCTTCWDGTLQQSVSTDCPTCYGTGWQGGFAAGVPLNGLLATGTYDLTLQEGGQYLPIAGTFLWTDPADALLLPLDLVIGQATLNVVYLVGSVVQMPGPIGAPFVRVVALELLAPDSPFRLVPVP